MKLGFVTAILPDMDLEQVVQYAAETGYECIEVMCWPKGKAERRYAGVTHIDVAALNKDEAAKIDELLNMYGISISGLGYYPNPLTPNEAEAQVYVEHIKKLITAAPLLGLRNINTFIGRDWSKTIDANWPRFKQVWPSLVKFAEDHGVKIGIENCPMFFTNDEWPGGKNLAHTPKVWRRMFEEIPSDSFGLNFDPSHLIWQGIDVYQAVQEFGHKFVHVHAKDARLDVDRLYNVGFLANPNEYHTPKLPGLGDVNWGEFFSALTDVGYQGPVCVEVEDRAYEGEIERRKAALNQSYAFLRQYIA
ncbi:MAG: sugar phosphate isomerase/epimerase [Calditrichaeota bacterium]|nr:MAG: sugar phosphate isomerase/epimerase [Calditrichota bacterium]